MEISQSLVPATNARGGWGALNTGSGNTGSGRGCRQGGLKLGNGAGPSPRCHARGPFGPGEPPGSSGLDPGEGSGGEPAGSRPATGEPGTSVCFPGPGCVLNTRLKPENGSRQPSEFHCWLDTAQWQSRSENECTTPQ